MKTALLALAAGAALAASGAAQSSYEVGSPVPRLNLPDIAGETTIDLRSFLGRKLVLFEFASW